MKGLSHIHTYVTENSFFQLLVQRLTTNPLLIPQGSVLGLLLFTINMNDITTCFDLLKYHLFAEDTNVCY